MTIEKMMLYTITGTFETDEDNAWHYRDKGMFYRRSTDGRELHYKFRMEMLERDTSAVLRLAEDYVDTFHLKGVRVACETRSEFSRKITVYALTGDGTWEVVE